MRETTAAVLMIAAGVASAQVPSTGPFVAELSEVDDALHAIFDTSDLLGATVAVSASGRIVYERGFGYADRDATIPLAENALLRTASVSKPITAAAINRLAGEGRLSLEDYAFNFNGNGGILTINPVGGLGDPRLADVTVQHLLDHRGGWDQSIAGDLAGHYTQARHALGVNASQADTADYARYWLSQPLQHNPGDREAYSNIGYGFLGLIVEHVSGQTLDAYVDQHVFGPIGVPAWEVTPGRTFAADHSPREPFYESGFRSQSVFNPSVQVDAPYGSWDHEMVRAFGGQTASAKALALFAEEYIVAGPQIGRRRVDYTLGNGYVWVHTGWSPGTEAIVTQSTAGLTFAVLFNRQRDGVSFSSEAFDLLLPILEYFGNNDLFPNPLAYPADMDRDQWHTDADVALFNEALRLVDAAAFAAEHPDADFAAADLDASGLVDGDDVQAFRDALAYAGVPEDVIAGVGVAPCPADFNGDALSGDIFDLFDFLAALDAGLDYNADTVPADVFDLFDFLADLDVTCP